MVAAVRLPEGSTFHGLWQVAHWLRPFWRPRQSLSWAYLSLLEPAITSMPQGSVGLARRSRSAL